jgi:hypothetical protein
MRRRWGIDTFIMDVLLIVKLVAHSRVP